MDRPHDSTQDFLDSHEEVRPGQEFAFRCHPGIDCFNACCGNLDLSLTPYDSLRLRRALALPSASFINTFARILVSPETGFPMLRLNMRDDERRSCPFVTRAGCSVYPDRPGACRIYPLGRATRLDESGSLIEQYFLIREPHCHGFAETTAWSPTAWFSDQGLESYNVSNDRLMSLIMRHRAGGMPINQKQTSMALLALYQPDAFQEFIKKMNLFARVDIDPERQAKVLSDEEAALEFGLDWLELILLGRSDNLRQRQ